MDEQTQPVEAPVFADIYVGSAKVAPVTLPSGLISVTIEGVEIKATQEQFDSMKSDKPYEDGLVMIRKWKPTITKILTILTSDNCEMQDKDFVIQRVDQSILENFRAASAKLFNVTDNGHVTFQQIIDIVSHKV